MSVGLRENSRVAVVGLGYVGLPLALRLSERFKVVGLDQDVARIAELLRGHDRTGEIATSILKSTALIPTSESLQIVAADIYIVTVPTPVDADNRPDLSAVIAACVTIGGAMRPGAIVVFECTVYPGVTEDICGRELEDASGLKRGVDFFLGYSPERINPGDREHTVDRIIKVVAGENENVTDVLCDLYGQVTDGGVYRAENIKTAEAAKVIENAQRDINIAFVNEVAIICSHLGIKTHDVLATARSKWNFLPFEPGLVGGHCIGVDPYYIAHLARELGHNSEVILAGRKINDSMAGFVVEQIVEALAGTASARILVLGLTFKENVPDLRNSKVADLIAGLGERGHRVDVHDPTADPVEAQMLYGIELLTDLDAADGYDAVIGAVSHHAYRKFNQRSFAKILVPGGVIADLKGMWRTVDVGERFRRWEL